MRILLTNDDGIHAPGLEALYDSLTDRHGDHDGPVAGVSHDGILTVAPLTVQSATSHGVTFMEPLMVREELVHGRMPGVAVDGRPADCVKVAASAIWPERFGEGARPELVISGMNTGANCGINVLYSGTVAAAIEAAFLGIPSIAVSLHLGPEKSRLDVAARHARTVIDRVLAQNKLAPHSCININIPRTTEDRELPPVRVCPINVHGLIDAFERRTSPRGDAYYWAAGGGLDFHATDPDSDVDALMKGMITVTPLTYDLTDFGQLEGWRALETD